MSVIPALRGPQKEDHHDFKVNLGYYIERSCFKYNIFVYCGGEGVCMGMCVYVCTSRCGLMLLRI